MKKLIVTYICLIFAVSANAEVPPPVTDECNKANADSYYNMPACLKEGAVAYEMLNLALQEDYYGRPAQKVIDGCRERNETFETVWICFKNAADLASETRSLIGVQNMRDQCYIDVSDPEVFDRIKKVNRQFRTKYFGEEYSFGGGTYYRFNGCPEPEKQSRLEDTGETGRADGFGEPACSTYREIDEILAARTASELEGMFKTIEKLPKDQRLKSLSMAGVSGQSIEFIQNADEKQAMGTAFIVAALMQKHHPLLLEEFMDRDKTATDPVADKFGGLFFTSLLNMALEGYNEQCLSTETR